MLKPCQNIAVAELCIFRRNDCTDMMDNFLMAISMCQIALRSDICLPYEKWKNLNNNFSLVFYNFCFPCEMF